MHEARNEDEQIKLLKDDGFGKIEPEDDYIVWKNEDHTHNQYVFYLHGAVHLFDTGSELEKYTWINSRISLIEQARAALKNNKFPLFVAEGKSLNKLAKIKHQPYLHHCYKSFLQALKEDRRKKSEKSLFIYGHSLTESDNHIIDKIGRGSFSKLFVSIYGDPELENNQAIIGRVKKLKECREEKHSLEINFYDAISAEAWGNT